MSSKSSRTEPRTDLPDRVTVGRVVRPHGLRGEVVVAVLTDVPGRFAPGNTLLMAREEGGPAEPVEVVLERPHKGGAVIRFAGVEDCNRAEELRGRWLEVERSQVPPAPPGVYYHYELLGCRCLEGGRDLGAVVDLVEDGGGLLLIVADGERRVPIPFVAGFLREVDVAAGRIELELPPGLIDVCASRS
ncbi:MAG TPA: 16S rRNA processing protein RimM [Acidobacteria bacterium]|nr:16S rRNA processing protein RimM [Acidobacteriota bacterium]